MPQSEGILLANPFGPALALCDEAFIINRALRAHGEQVALRGPRDPLHQLQQDGGPLNKVYRQTETARILLKMGHTNELLHLHDEARVYCTEALGIARDLHSGENMFVPSCLDLMANIMDAQLNEMMRVESQWEPSRVRVRGLASKPQFNGLCGYIINKVSGEGGEQPRVYVVLDHGKKKLSLKGENLQAVLSIAELQDIRKKIKNELDLRTSILKEALTVVIKITAEKHINTAKAYHELAIHYTNRVCTLVAQKEGVRMLTKAVKILRQAVGECSVAPVYSDDLQCAKDYLARLTNEPRLLSSLPGVRPPSTRAEDHKLLSNIFSTLEMHSSSTTGHISADLMGEWVQRLGVDNITASSSDPVIYIYVYHVCVYIHIYVYIYIEM